MAVTITNHQIRSADTPPTAGLCDGGWTVTWLPGRVLTEGQAAAMEIAGAASQIPGPSDGLARGQLWRCRGSWSRRR